MPRPPRDLLARLLAGASDAADSASIRLPADALTVSVDGIGPVPTPIRAVHARQLIATARPAPYGHGEQTLSDRSVRDTWEIDPSRVRLGGPAWQQHLDEALREFTAELGLPAGARLAPELHSLLVYGAGQFFLPHQDSEKHDAMVATLVVMLPSVHRGGALVIDDRGSERSYEGDREELVLVAFYADRRHEVLPVRSGHRVTLAFNLLLDSSGVAAAGDDVDRAAALLEAHFATPAVDPYGVREPGEPRRLAFLLDHEYTERGLAGGHLKGADAERVATLRAAAERAQCEVVLALAEIKETWDAVPRRASGSHGFDGWDDEDESWDGDADEVDVDDLNELLDDEIVLDWWTSPGDGAGERIELALGQHEVCALTPTKTLTPYRSEYEGYMGNYGNTVDRWYRRAAAVLWPVERAFAARAEASSAWALQALLERIDAGELEQARAAASSLAPFWLRIEPALLQSALRVAAGLADASAASVIAAPFRLEAVRAEHAPLLASLARAYGEPWSRALLRAWTEERGFTGGKRLGWISSSLGRVCTALREEGAPALADACAGDAWRHVWALAAGALLRADRATSGPAIAAIAADVERRLERLADAQARAEGDWSIAWSGCGCELCARLAAFLGSASDTTLDWPIAQARRQHVHRQIDDADLPVRHVTRRTGSPYTLVLTKTRDVFEREADARARAGAELARVRGAFGTPRP